jgi:hypothetical protein
VTFIRIGFAVLLNQLMGVPSSGTCVYASPLYVFEKRTVNGERTPLPAGPDIRPCEVNGIGAREFG